MTGILARTSFERGPGARRGLGCAAACFVAAGAVAHARPTPQNYGHDFVTVGAPGNRPVNAAEMHFPAVTPFFEPNLGRVDYSYRISRTEMTTSQWFDFVNVYWPIAEANGVGRQDPTFVGSYIQAANVAQGPPNYFYAPNVSNVATTMSPVFAMRYCNWLQAGRPTTGVTNATFETGAYDVATLTRMAGAQYWIPSNDEWTKAVHYDPNRYGVGQEGYWDYPGMSTTPLVGGPPGTPGAQTSAGGWVPVSQIGPPVGSYPHVVTPWGLLDASGGEREMTDTIAFGDPQRGFYARGSGTSSSTINVDAVDYLLGSVGATGGRSGFRIASAVPAPSIALALIVPVLPIARRRRCPM